MEDHLHKQIKYFAYPYGDYNKQVQDKLIASGYEAIFTVAGNPVHATTSQYRVGRYVITSPEEKDFTSYLRQGALSIMSASPELGATESNPPQARSCLLTGCVRKFEKSDISIGNFTTMLNSLLEGLALIIFGIRFLRKGLDRLFGSRLSSWLANMTQNRWQAFGAGIAAGTVAPRRVQLP